MRVQPRAARTELAGEWEGALRVRVSGQPVQGAANAELIRYLARRLHVGRTSIRLAAGGSARTKRIEVHGLEPDVVAARLT